MWMQYVRYCLVVLGLFALWLVLGFPTGHPQVGLGLTSVLAVTLLAIHLGLIDAESVPFRIGARIVWFWGWLAKEIFLSAIDVSKRILVGRSMVAPRTETISAGQHSDLMRVILANSITLTPATVTLDVEEDKIYVHTLTGEAAEDLAEGGMTRRVNSLWRRPA